MEKYDLIIKGGRIVTEAGVFLKDIGIKEGKIAAIEDVLQKNGERVINAEGKYLFPGGIDVHTHLDLHVGQTVSSDDFTTGTIAAACGGTTTIIDFVTQDRGESLKEAIEKRHREAEGKAVIDYSFHISPTVINDETLALIPSLIEDGYPSFKLYMTYDFRVNDGELIKVLVKTRDYGGLVCVHAENFYMIDYMVKEFKATGKIEPRYHPLSRPPFVEGEATGRAIKLARLVEAPIYIVHVTCRDSFVEVVKARDGGYPVMAETCPQYLFLSMEKYEEPDFQGAKYVLSPPLRSREHQHVLWDGLVKGKLQVVATDHCPFNFKGQKELGKDFFGNIPSGLPGIETRLALLYGLGVARGKLSVRRFIEITSTNPAKIFGLYPQKGTIAIGSDADIVIIDPEKEVILTKGILHENVDYTPYENFTLKGFPVATISRGKLIVENGRFIGALGSGKFLKRNRPILM